MNFQILALNPEPFRALFDLGHDELEPRHICRVVADSKPGFPCRVSLEDAEIGETLLLVNYKHLDVSSPYAASHAIYIREGVQQAKPAPGEIPAVLKSRILSVRGFDGSHMMRSADIVEGPELGSKLSAMFLQTAIAFIDIHNAKQGCFAARAIRS